MEDEERRERILVVEDDPDMRTMLVAECEEEGYSVSSCSTAEEAQRALVEEPVDLVLSDLRLPGDDGMSLLHRSRALDPAPSFLLITAFGTIEKAVEALKKGADDFLTKPLDLDHLMLTVERILQTARLRREVHRLREQLGDSDFHGMVGRSPPMRRLYREIRQMARAEGPVLVQGESGTGKELVARALHEESPRSGEPFLAVNCAGVPRELLESEFFGHVEGSFTGATHDREGLFAEADGGTLLLDEVTEMPADLQAKLLRVLQEGEVRRVGDNRVRSVDVRVVASTNREVEEEVGEGRLREDLFYRLQTFALEVPPLRDRGDDLELLAGHFLHKYAAAIDRRINSISPEALELLETYSWPGNVRELENAVERAVAFSSGDVLAVEDLPDRVREEASDGRPAAEELEGPSGGFRLFPDEGRVPSLEELEDRYIRQVLELADGNKSRAASLLGISRRTLYRKLDRAGASDG